MGEEVFSKWGDRSIYIRMPPLRKGLLALAVAAGGATFSDLQEVTDVIGNVNLCQTATRVGTTTQPPFKMLEKSASAGIIVCIVHRRVISTTNKNEVFDLATSISQQERDL